MVLHELDVIVTRGNAVESHHRVHAAVVGACDRMVGSAGDPAMSTWWRSCAKPFQIVPLIESGGFDALGWGDEELAVACASHGGEPEHVAIVERMLLALGLEEGDLACGPLEPLSPRGARIARESGSRIGRIHNNCSGKHAAMLALAIHKGWPIRDYEKPDHPVQQAMLNQVALWSDSRPSQLGIAIDGCGVVVFRLSLERMARAYARLAAAARKGEEIAARIVNAITRNPFLIGGTERFDSMVIEETGGGVITKVGAEGVHSALIVDDAMGMAIKVEDGNPRAQHPAMVQLLMDLGALPEPVPSRLSEYLSRPVRNTRGEVVGETKLRDSARRRPQSPAQVASI